MSEGEITVVNYRGGGDAAVWLDKVCELEPVLLPLWPADYPEFLCVYMSPSGELGVPSTRSAMMSVIGPDHLWFCRVPRAEFAAQTDLEE